MNFLPKCDVVVSATASPNYTLRRELFDDITLTKPLLLLDLAVPRDIEPALGGEEGVTLYDMDSFRTERISPESMESITKAGEIVRAQMDEFFQWLDGRDPEDPGDQGGCSAGSEPAYPQDPQEYTNG